MASPYSIFTLPGGKKFRVAREIGREIHLVNAVAKKKQLLDAQREVFVAVKLELIRAAREKLKTNQTGTVHFVSPYWDVAVHIRQKYLYAYDMIMEAKRQFAKIEIEGSLAKKTKNYDPEFIQKVKDTVAEIDFDAKFDELFDIRITFVATHNLHKFLQQRVPAPLKPVQQLIKDAFSAKPIEPQIILTPLIDENGHPIETNASKRFKKVYIDKTHTFDGHGRVVRKKKKKDKKQNESKKK